MKNENKGNDFRNEQWLHFNFLANEMFLQRNTKIQHHEIHFPSFSHTHILLPPFPCAVRKFRYGCKRNRIITIKNLVMTKSLTKKLLLLLLWVALKCSEMLCFKKQIKNRADFIMTFCLLVILAWLKGKGIKLLCLCF